MTFLGAVPIAVGVVALVYTYKTTGANELRSGVYQPLFSDLVNLENCVQAVMTDPCMSARSLGELKRTGAFSRIPTRLRERIEKVAEQTDAIHIAAIKVRERVVAEMSDRISQIRTEPLDRKWLENAERIIRQESKSKKGRGITDIAVFAQMTHEGRSRGVDTTDPSGPTIVSPGGPSFVVRDWLEYPASLGTIERLFTDLDYLYFNETSDTWFLRVTREDFKMTGTTLADFLRPTYQRLTQDQEFNFLLRTRTPLLAEIADLKRQVTDRVRDPKRIRDLFTR